MYAMRYTIQLPTTYDMGIVRDRVATTGHLMDGFGGLRFKAFAIREVERGASANEYATYYVWDDVDGMRAFCWGEPGYSAIVRDFGRHPIHDATVVGVTDGPTGYGDVRGLVLGERPLPEGEAPSRVVDDLTGGFLASAPDTTAARVATLDVTTWTLGLVELVSSRPDQSPRPDGSIAYEVLHVATGPR